MVTVELNGFDEGGYVGTDINFVRVGIEEERRLRPLIYNILHFGRPTIPKKQLTGMPLSMLSDYVKMAWHDPGISVTHYSLSSEHQLQILRRFKAFEDKKLFGKRAELISAIQNDNKNAMWDFVSYLRRYQSTPLWTEMFMKSYCYRFIINDLPNRSKVLRRAEFPRCPCFVDGGYPFVCWWEKGMYPNVPVYGITNGDEYYPIINMAGTIASITKKQPALLYPHNNHSIKSTEMEDLGEFYNVFSANVDRPKFFNRILFVGRLHEHTQYAIPFLKHISEGHKVFEPMCVNMRIGLEKFHSRFGKRKDDIIVVGKGVDSTTRTLCESAACEVHTENDFLDGFIQLHKDIQEEAKMSNLSNVHIHKIISRTEKTIESVKTHLGVM